MEQAGSDNSKHGGSNSNAEDAPRKPEKKKYGGILSMFGLGGSEEATKITPQEIAATNPKLDLPVSEHKATVYRAAGPQEALHLSTSAEGYGIPEEAPRKVKKVGKVRTAVGEPMQAPEPMETPRPSKKIKGEDGKVAEAKHDTATAEESTKYGDKGNRKRTIEEYSAPEIEKVALWWKAKEDQIADPEDYYSDGQGEEIGGGDSVFGESEDEEEVKRKADIVKPKMKMVHSDAIDWSPDGVAHLFTGCNSLASLTLDDELLATKKGGQVHRVYINETEWRDLMLCQKKFCHRCRGPGHDEPEAGDRGISKGRPWCHAAETQQIVGDYYEYKPMPKRLNDNVVLEEIRIVNFEGLNGIIEAKVLVCDEDTCLDCRLVKRKWVGTGKNPSEFDFVPEFTGRRVGIPTPDGPKGTIQCRMPYPGFKSSGMPELPYNFNKKNMVVAKMDLEKIRANQHKLKEQKTKEVQAMFAKAAKVKE